MKNMGNMKTNIRGFVLSIDAILAVGMILIISGSVLVISENSSRNTNFNEEAIGHDYLTLKYIDGITYATSEVQPPLIVIKVQTWLTRQAIQPFGILASLI